MGFWSLASMLGNSVIFLVDCFRRRGGGKQWCDVVERWLWGLCVCGWWGGGLAYVGGT